jgi:IS30 family transposase
MRTCGTASSCSIADKLGEEWSPKQIAGWLPKAYPHDHSMRVSHETDAISIRERPAEALDRAVPGHWEADLLEGSKGTQIATLVERHSRFVMLVRIPHKGSASVVKALGKTIQRLPQQLRRSLTWDRGIEMNRHKDFTIATNVQVYKIARKLNQRPRETLGFDTPADKLALSVAPTA